MAANMQEKLSDEFSKAFYEDNFPMMQKLYTEINTLGLHPNTLEYLKFEQDAKVYNEVLELILSSEWDLVSDVNDIKVETCNSGADFYTKASVVVPAGILKALAVMSEVDLLPNWIHALSQVTQLYSPCKFKKLMRYHFWFPWPLTNRECLLDFAAYPVSEKQAMLILMKSPEKYLGLDMPLPDANSVRMEVDIGGIFVQWVDINITRVQILVKANAKIGNLPGLLPEWLVSFGKKQIMYFLMDALRHVLVSFEGSEYEARVQEKKEFYNTLRKVLVDDLGVIL